MMKENFVLITGIVILLILLFNYRKSQYTIKPFDANADATAVRTNLKSQVAEMVAEMSSELKAAKAANKTDDERIAIANTYNDQMMQLNKNFSEWSIRHGVL